MAMIVFALWLLGLLPRAALAADVLHELALPPSKLLEGGKMAHLARLLPQLRAEGHRALLFSQWTTVLDVIALALDHLQTQVRAHS